MNKVAISCDTTAALSSDEIQQLGVFVLPLNVIVDEQEFHDTVDITPSILADKMRHGSDIKTSTPTPYEMEQFFDNILAKGYQKVIHFTISSKLSSINSMFTTLCAQKYGDKVIIVDALSVCSFMGSVVKHAVKLNQMGLTSEQIVSECNKWHGIENIYFIPESLTFLKRGGRISPLAASVGNLLGIKPVLRFISGEILKGSTTRSVKQFLPVIIKDFKSHNYDPSEYDIHIVEFDCPATTQIAYEAMKESFPNFQIHITPISINVCAHCGPGTIGIGVTYKF